MDKKILKKIPKVENETQNKKSVESYEEAQCNFKIEKTLQEEFKHIVYHTKGWKPGSMKEAFQEAVELWIKVNKENGRI